MSQDLAIITSEDLSLVSGNVLNELQLAQILKRTPSQYVKQRPAKGGGTWDYVTGGYVKKCLNIMFGWDWDFEILDEKVLFGEVVIKGRLTCRTEGRSIVKTQFGNKDIIFKKETDKDGNRIPLSIGNDMKAAATDALKKCAAEIGIASDIYNKEDFREVKLTTSKTIDKEDLELLFDSYSENLREDDQISIKRILDQNETQSYAKAYKLLNQIAKKKS
jgi:hypothetical protein